MIGKRLAHYEILELLGAGGMGEVFRARDTRLGRDVAIKAMPEAFAQDAERLARFEREARVLASLNHPNVAAIHGIEEAEGHRYLVLEFVDGETLAARIRRGALPIGEAIEVCRQIAAGVEAAHESGVIHRDLKPGNVMITSEGGVKVLDFGLAIGGGDGTPGFSGDLSHSPTIASPATGAGVILGTAAYMSPEQARGKTMDRRTDIWSFGCVLYECLTGKQLFGGETVSDIIARILEREPDWETLPAATPPRLRELLRRCLRKDPKERLRDIGDARLELAEPQVGAASAAATSDALPRRARPLPWMIASGALMVALAASLFVRPAPKTAEQRSLRVSVALSPGMEVSEEPPDAVLSPDGEALVFVAADTTGATRLYERRLDAAVIRPIPGTDRARLPFWSPDGRQIGFFSDGNLKRMGIDGSGVQVICPAPAPRGGAWGPNDVIVFQPNASGPLLQIPASGGTPVPATTLDETRNETAHRFPDFLPDGKHFLYVTIPGPQGVPETRVGTLDAVPGPVLLASMSRATFAAPGYVLFNQNESVVAQPFDPALLTLTGKPRLVPDLYNAAASYAGSPVVMASEDGKLVQRELNLSGQALELRDLSGRVIRRLGLPAGKYDSPAFSPDQARIALTYARVDEYLGKVWIVDLARDLSTRFAFVKGFDSSPQWTLDGSRIIWGSDQETGRELFWKRSDGSGSEELFADVPNLFNDPSCVTSQFVVFESLSGETTRDIWVAPLEGEHTPKPLLQTPFDEGNASVSPDERWMAYRSNESGRYEVYVTSFPEPGRKVRVSSAGTTNRSQTASFRAIKWRSDGRELYYIAADARTLMAVPVETGASFRSGTPKALFRCSRETQDAVVSPDGQRVLTIVPADPNERSILNLVINWSSALEP